MNPNYDSLQICNSYLHIDLIQDLMPEYLHAAILSSPSFAACKFLEGQFKIPKVGFEVAENIIVREIIETLL